MTSIFDEMERDALEIRRLPTEEESLGLTRLGQELVDIDARLAKYAQVARELTARKAEIQHKLLPDAMEAVGQDVIGMGDQGVDLVLEDYFKAGLPNPENGEDDKERARLAALRAEGIQFLTEDAPDLLSTDLVVRLPKGSLELAQMMRRTLVALFGAEATAARRLEFLNGLDDDPGLLATLAARNEPGFDPVRAIIVEGVHWATLTSYVKEQIRQRKRSDLPLEALGATVGRIVKIVKRKAKK